MGEGRETEEGRRGREESKRVCDKQRGGNAAGLCISHLCCSHSPHCLGQTDRQTDRQPHSQSTRPFGLDRRKKQTKINVVFATNLLNQGKSSTSQKRAPGWTQTWGNNK